MKCNKCDREMKKIVYRKQENNTLHLVGLCENDGWRYLPFEKGLDIPIIESKLKSKRVNGERVELEKTEQNTLL